MSALRIRPWRALESLQRTGSISKTPRTGSITLIRTINTSSNRFQSTSTPAAPKQTAPATQPSSSSPSTPARTSVSSSTPNRQTTDSISKSGLSDKPLELENPQEDKIDWTRSFHGLSAEPFPKEAADILLASLDAEEVEIKPDGILYLPEIKYRRVLNKAFGPGAWGLVPRGESIVTPKTVTREYALVCHGR